MDDIIILKKDWINFMLIESFLDYCVQNNIVSDEDIPVLRYYLEKRIFTVVVSVPIFAFGTWLSDLVTTLSFLATFYYLRSTTNGYHASNVGACLVGSLLIEICLLKWIEPLLSPILILSISISCIFIVGWLAPYNHPLMNLSIDEVCACRTVSRKRLTLLIILLVLSSLLSDIRIRNGITIGIFAASALLCLAYIIEWRNHYVKNIRN